MDTRLRQKWAAKARAEAETNPQTRKRLNALAAALLDAQQKADEQEAEERARIAREATR